MYLNKKEDSSSLKYDVDFLETLVYEWIRRSIHFKHFRLSNAILTSTALKFKSILNLQSFSASKEWLEKFRETYDLKDAHTRQQSIEGYKFNKSILPMDIFNDLQPKWASLDPKLCLDKDRVQNSIANENGVKVYDIEEEFGDVEIIDVNQIKKDCKKDLCTKEEETRKEECIEDIQAKENSSMYDENNTDFLDIEDELPVCTIFGRKTVQNVANIISSNQNSKEETFQPMIVCTDPKNPSLNVIHKGTTTLQDQTQLKSPNIPEVEKIKDLISGKTIENDSNSLNQTEYIDQYLREIVSVPENDKIIYKAPSNQPAPETINDKPIFKPISMFKIRNKKVKPKQMFELPSNSSPGSIDNPISMNLAIHEYEQLTKLNRKRKVKENSVELPETISDDDKNQPVDQKPSPSAIKQPTMDVNHPLVDFKTSLQTSEITNQMPTIIQTWNPIFPVNIITSNHLQETSTSQSQTSVIGPGGIIYTFQMAAPNQNQLTMPYITPITTNMQTSQFGQPTTLSPLLLQFNSPIISSDLINLTQSPTIPSQTFIPSIDLTQQPTQLTNLMQDQFVPNNQSIKTTDQQISTLSQTQSTLATSTMLTSTLQSATSNSSLTSTIIPTKGVLNNLPTKSKSLSIKRIQVPAITKTQTVTSTISSLPTVSIPTVESIPSAVQHPAMSHLPTKSITCPSNFASTTFMPKTSNPIQLPLSTMSIAALNSVPAKPTETSTNILPVKLRSTTITRIQVPASTKPPTITTSSISKSSLTEATGTGCLNFTPVKITPTISQSTQVPISSKLTPTPRIQTPAASTSPRIQTPPVLSTSTAKPSINSVQKTPTHVSNLTQISKPTTQMQVTITKQLKPQISDAASATAKKGTKFARRAPLKNQEEVSKCIKLIEDFAMMNENFRLIGFLERLEKHISNNK
ncbi:uncharacterized protein LOC129947411 [Eupeodes corollae]|uniref:uncharacterized protein LOC129947411 n=1 Tax=Eupeodes corollae TaxID=290404 RepID=UPI002492AE09|nr:uncharacterized protein LOC129947411 [Eupeodes corollae]XP_055913927.1 uncharacterized protein LOC129947411 [Eupeodes corollae]